MKPIGITPGTYDVVKQRDADLPTKTSPEPTEVDLHSARVSTYSRRQIQLPRAALTKVRLVYCVVTKTDDKTFAFMLLFNINKYVVISRKHYGKTWL